MSLHRRDTAELLSEELRRLDPDEVYAESIAPLATGLVLAPAPAAAAADGGQADDDGHAAGGGSPS